jgi:hypothetical protein
MRGGTGLSCTPVDFAQFVTKDETLEQLLSDFPGGIAMLFPQSRPLIGEDLDRWPSAESRSHYFAALRRSKNVITGAKHIFVLGRVSVGEAPKQAEKLAFERIAFARRLLADLYKDEGELALSELDRKIFTFSIVRQRQTAAPFFIPSFWSRVVAWDEASEQELIKVLGSPGNAPAEKQKWAAGVVNQATFIVPIPCEGSETEDN